TASTLAAIPEASAIAPVRNCLRSILARIVALARVDGDRAVVALIRGADLHPARHQPLAVGDLRYLTPPGVSVQVDLVDPLIVPVRAAVRAEGAAGRSLAIVAEE